MAASDDVLQIEKLKDAESFQVWKFQISVVFKSNGNWEIVNGTRKYEELSKPEEKSAWEKQDAKAQKTIVTSIDKKLMTHIINCKYSKDMFQKLCGIFQQGTEEQKCSLLREFFNYSYKKGTDLSLHISCLQNIVCRLESLNHKIDDSMFMSKLLVTLPDEYKHFNTAWESTSMGDRTVTSLIARLLNEETRHKLSSESEGAVAFKAGHSRFNKLKCYRCGKLGHISKSCFMKNGNKERKQCIICKKTNHVTEDCYFRKKHAQTSEEKKVAFFIGNSDRNDTLEFIVDSGATSHMVQSKEMLIDMRKCETEVGTAKEDQNMKAEGEGSIDSEFCILKNVLYIPQLSKNLLSVNAIIKNGGEVKFTNNGVSILKDNKEVIRGEKQENGLFLVNLKKESKEKEKANLSENKKQLVQDWHKKLGHLSKTSMKKVIKMTTGMNLCEKDCEYLDGVCEICTKAKQTRLPFDDTRTQASRPLEIVHTDVCGPIDPVTWDNKKYVVTFLDDYTHFSKVHLLNGKYEVSSCVKEYIMEAEAHFNLKASVLRCDNGKEYLNNELKSWCKSRGIVIDTTIPYTPQLNGKAERLNRTIMEKARALIFDSGMEKQFWGEAVYMATYLLNRSPTDSLEVTPVEMWSTKTPDLKRLQIFGCNAYAKVLGYLKKFDERSKKYVFIGYGTNGYRLWDEKNQKVVIYRDVIFETKNNRKTTENMSKVKINDTEEDEEISEKQSQNEEIYTEPDQIEDNIVQEINKESDERPKRNIKLPGKLNDYVMLTYQEAVNSTEKDKWLHAIDEEKASLEKNNTWNYINQNEVQEHNVLTSKWVFKIKDDGKYKARLVIRGFEQQYGIDYQETFSPVVNMTCLRILFALAANKNFFIKKFDIKTAFLYGELSEQIYMEVPEGYDEKNKVCLLKKSLYGLKQASLNWNQRFTKFLLSKGLVAIKTEHCIFKNKNGTMFLAIYVDDGIIFSKNEQEMQNLLIELNKEFEMTTSDNPNKFLGIEIKKTDEFLFLTQRKYCENILKTFSMQNARSMSTPMVEYNKQAGERGDEDNITSKQSFPYRELVGSLLYLTNKTRPDIQFAVNLCSRKLNTPIDVDVTNAKHILKYLRGKESEGVCFKRNSDCKRLVAFCDSDFAGDPTSRKSTTGYIIYYCNGPISWTSRKQPIVSLSSTEAEFIAAAECTKELLYVKSVIEELLGESVMTELNVDNQSALNIIKNGQFGKRSKHIDVRFHFINEKVSEGLIKVNYCETNEQIADIFTKPLCKNKFAKFKGELMFGM